MCEEDLDLLEEQIIKCRDICSNIIFENYSNVSRDDINLLAHVFDVLLNEKEELVQWVNDLQSGMYVNCVYCGYRYGPKDEVPESMAEVLKKHIEECPKHPMSKLKKENEELKEKLKLMAMLASDKPLFYNPIDVAMIKKMRDEIIENG